MTLDVYLAYVLASLVVLVLPGPTVLLVLGYALSGGRRMAWRTVPGVMAGDALAVSLALAGLGALVAASAAVFATLKWIGAAYLVWLGLRQWRQAPQSSLGAQAPDAPAQRPGHRVALHAFAVTALNPKSIAFFVAFLPQFMRPHAPLLPQALLLGGTWVALAGVSNGSYALLAGSLRERLRRPATQRALNRLGGGVLIGAGALTAAMRRAA